MQDEDASTALLTRMSWLRQSAHQVTSVPLFCYRHWSLCVICSFAF